MTSTSNYFLFAGSYAPATEPGIHAFAFNSDTGELTPQGSFTGITSPSFLTIHPNGRWLYAVSETGLGSHGQAGSVWAFEIQPETMALQPLNQQSTNGDWPCHVAIDATGRWIIASNYGSGNAGLYPITADGSLGEMASFVQHAGKGPNKARQEGPHAHSATFTPDNNYVIVADLGIDQLVMYTFNANTGSLKKHTEIETRPGSGPRHFAFHPNNHVLYCASELDNTVTAYAYDAEAGSLKALQTLSTLPEDDSESSVADIHVSGDGTRLYVSNRGHNSLAVFEVDADGGLTCISYPSCGGNWPRNFAMGPTGRFVLVANRRTNNIVSLPIGSNAAEVGEAANTISVSEPSCIKILKIS